MSGTVTPDELEFLLKGKSPLQVLDIRRPSDRQYDPSSIPGAIWMDTEKAGEWGKDLGNGDVVIYCVRGGSVSRSVQEKLREKNISARFIEGGIEAWKKSGKPVKNL
jgi:rhodanese-related sulfurtransferase